MAFLGVECPPGASRRERVQVGEYADGSPVSLPVHIVRGRKDGPTLYVQGAVDGEEVTGVEIARRVIASVKPAELIGTLVVVPASNLPAYLTRSRAWLDEERYVGELTALLPGWAGGLMSERIAAILLTEFMQPADVTIDLHSAIDGAVIAPFTYVFPDQNDGTYRTCLRIALAFGAPYVYRVDQIPEADKPKLPLSIRPILKGYGAGTEGNAITIAEMGESQRISTEYVDIGLGGIFRVLKAMGMIDDHGYGEGPEPRPFTQVAPVHVNRGGGLRSYVSLGDEVQPGDLLAEIVDVFGDPVERVVAPMRGFVLRKMVLANVATGAEAAWIAA
ncbi:MAG: succinylglutamate desuccinylase/aspartoacylase family protein [Solirubrobacterales bacterium]